MAARQPLFLPHSSLRTAPRIARSIVNRYDDEVDPAGTGFARLTAHVGVAAKEAETVSVLATLWLFGKPGQELDEGGEVTGDQIRALAQCLSERLQRVGDIVEKMTGAGWDAQMGLYDVMLSHPYVRTESEARTRLDDLGI